MKMVLPLTAKKLLGRGLKERLADMEHEPLTPEMQRLLEQLEKAGQGAEDADKKPS